MGVPCPWKWPAGRRRYLAQSGSDDLYFEAAFALQATTETAGIPLFPRRDAYAWSHIPDRLTQILSPGVPSRSLLNFCQRTTPDPEKPVIGSFFLRIESLLFFAKTLL